jgi:hypothetical protein
VTCLAALVAAPPTVTIAAIFRRPRSAARAGYRAYWPSAHRGSRTTFRPSTYPSSRRPWREGLETALPKRIGRGARRDVTHPRHLSRQLPRPRAARRAPHPARSAGSGGGPRRDGGAGGESGQAYRATGEATAAGIEFSRRRLGHHRPLEAAGLFLGLVDTLFQLLCRGPGSSGRAACVRQRVLDAGNHLTRLALPWNTLLAGLVWIIQSVSPWGGST